jgi:ankyrin repeat protein
MQLPKRVPALKEEIESGETIRHPPPPESNPTLCDAARRGDFTLAYKLLENGADIEDISLNGRKAIHWAAEQGDDCLIQLLLNYSADMNSTDNDGISALHLACGNGHGSVVRLLLGAGADLELCETRNDCADMPGRTPLHWAARTGHEDIVALLLDAGANIESQKQWNRTPLYLAAKFGHVGAATVLLKQGARLDADEIENALRFAAAQGNLEMIQLLMDAGTDMEAAGPAGSNLDVAVKQGCTRLSEFLQYEHEARKEIKFRKRNKKGLGGLEGTSLDSSSLRNLHVPWARSLGQDSDWRNHESL